MKYNLKNFPIELMDLDLNPNYKRIEEWFEGFEKELQDMDNQMEVVGIPTFDVERKQIRDILGVDSS